MDVVIGCEGPMLRKTLIKAGIARPARKVGSLFREEAISPEVIYRRR
jgi:hypothetical protein